MLLLHLRLALPDRTGSLAAVARVFAAHGADIVGTTLLGREPDRVVADFYLSCAGGRANAVLPAVSGLRGVEVLGMRVATGTPSPLADLDLAEQLVADPRQGLRAVVAALPALIGCDWSALTGPAGVLVGVDAPPDLAAVEVSGPVAGVLPGGHSRLTLPAGTPGLAVQAGRWGGPPFHPFEIDHAGRLVVLALRLRGAAPGVLQLAGS